MTIWDSLALLWSLGWMKSRSEGRDRPRGPTSNIIIRREVIVFRQSPFPKGLAGVLLCVETCSQIRGLAGPAQIGLLWQLLSSIGITALKFEAILSGSVTVTT